MSIKDIFYEHCPICALEARFRRFGRRKLRNTFHGTAFEPLLRLSCFLALKIQRIKAFRLQLKALKTDNNLGLQRSRKFGQEGFFIFWT